MLRLLKIIHYAYSIYVLNFFLASIPQIRWERREINNMLSENYVFLNIRWSPLNSMMTKTMNRKIMKSWQLQRPRWIIFIVRVCVCLYVNEIGILFIRITSLTFLLIYDAETFLPNYNVIYHHFFFAKRPASKVIEDNWISTQYFYIHF